MKKKIISMLLVCLMIVSLFPMGVLAETAENCTGDCGHVAAIGTTHYDTLQEAIEYAEIGETITLLSDYIVPDTVSIYSPSMDGGQHPLEPSNYATAGMLVISHKSNSFTIVGDGKTVTGGITDSLWLGEDVTEENIICGTPNVTLKNIIFTKEGTVLEVMSENTVLTIESGSYASIAENGFVLMATGGRTNISGGTFSGTTAVAALGGDVNISGGTFSGALSDGSEYARTEWEGWFSVGTITITGGTFDTDPSACVADGYVAKPNNTTPETWTVTEEVDEPALPAAAVGKVDRENQTVTGTMFDGSG